MAKIYEAKCSFDGLDFEWSFGDGGGKFGQKVSHYYVYPGEYTLVVSADGYTVGGEAKMNVKVVAPDISISKVGMGGKENFIDLNFQKGIYILCVISNDGKIFTKKLIKE